MHTFLDAKHMAKALRQSLAAREIYLQHSDCLELVAKQFGFAEWNMLAARIEAAQLPRLRLPEGWFVSRHTGADQYRIGLDPDRPGTVLIQSIPGSGIAPGAIGVLMQSVAAAPWRGRKIRLSAELRCESADLATIWMRVDPEAGKALRFDNLLDRKSAGAIEGTQEWTERSIVLDVPAAAASVHYGIFLRETGRMWARNVRIGPVGDGMAVTGGPRLLDGPTNLDFSSADRPAA